MQMKSEKSRKNLGQLNRIRRGDIEIEVVIRKFDWTVLVRRKGKTKYTGKSCSEG